MQQKNFNNLINGNIFTLNVSSLRQDGWEPIYINTHISHTKYFSIPILSGFTMLDYIVKGHEICLNITNYPNFNMQDFKYLLCTSILNCFDHVVSPV